MDHKDVLKTYGEKLRVRSCGLLVENKKLLLLKMDGVGPLGELWAPPGGGVEFGESLKEAAKRELKEELNLTVNIKESFIITEFISPPLHAIEHFFFVERTNADPIKIQQTHENEKGNFITNHEWFSYEDIINADSRLFHQILQNETHLLKILKH